MSSQRPAAGAPRVVFLDVGGPIYDDTAYRTALLGALRDAGASVGDEEFAAELAARRREQAGFTLPVIERFLGAGADPEPVTRLLEGRWRYEPSSLYPDVLPALETLRRRYRLGLIANQPRASRDALERDGIGRYVEVWALSGEVGLAKPDPQLFTYAVEAAGVEPGEAVFVGDRLDNDIRPARAAGLRTVWLLRGEAPERPSASQLAEPDAVVRTLAELPAALEQLAAVSAAA